MNSSAIDQFLQIAAPARPASESLSAPGSDGPAFQEHLERAASEVKPRKNTEQEKEERTDLSSTASEKDTGASQKDESLVSSEIDEKPASETEAKVDDTVEADTDEVVVSDAAAVALADLATVPENEEIVAVLPTETSLEDAEDGSEEQARPQVAAEGDLSGESDQAENTDALLEAEVGAAPASPTEQKGFDEKLSSNSVDDLKLQAPNEAEGSPESEPEAANQAVPSTAVKQPIPEEGGDGKPQALEIEAESQDSSTDEKKSGQHESKPSQTATFVEKQAAQSETPDLAPENQPNTAAAAPTGETPASVSPQQASPSSVLADLSPLATANETAAATEARSEPEGTSTVDRARFVRRVGGAIQSAQSRDGKIQLQLRPSELGSLRIEITVKEGVVTARLEAETLAARTILLDNLPALRERLAEQEIRIEKFDVDVRDEGRPASDNPDTEDRQANRPERDSQGLRQNRNPKHEIEPNTQAINTQSIQIDSLDVSV